MGAGGDGTAQFLAKSAAAQAAVCDILLRDFGMPCLTVTIGASSPVRTAVIPAAGFGADLFPATKAVKAELFPVLTREGVAVPAIVMSVTELVDAGIERVVIVVQEEDLPSFRRLFKERVAPSNYAKLSPEMKKQANRLMELGSAVDFVVQEKQEGFGHAILCAKEAVGQHPFIVILSDHVSRVHALHLAFVPVGTAPTAQSDSPPTFASPFSRRRCTAPTAPAPTARRSCWRPTPTT